MTQLAGGAFIKKIQTIAQTKTGCDVSSGSYDYDYSADGYEDVTTLASSIFLPAHSCYSDQADPSDSLLRSYLQATGNIRFTMGSGIGSTSIRVYGQLIEFAPGIVKSKQEGTIALSTGASGSATITAVTLANSIVFYQGAYTTASTDSHRAGATSIQLWLSATTTVSCYRYTSGAYNLTVAYCVIEFNHL